MVRINLDTDKFSPEERENRKKFTNLEPTIPIPENGIHHVYCTNNIRFHLKKTNFDSRGVIDGFYVEEDMRRQFFYPYLPCDFLDVGVAHGSWSLPALATGSKVLGFEIDPRYQETFKEQILVNENFYKRMKLFSLGLYNAYGVGSVFELEDVIFVKLDDFMKYAGLCPQYVKIDVEGMELRVLEGARKTIDLLRPKIFIEIHYIKDATQEYKDKADALIVDLLKEYNYVYQKGRVEEAFTYFFFYNKDE